MPTTTRSVSVSLKLEHIQRLEDLEQQTKRSRSSLIEEALDSWFQSLGGKRVFKPRPEKGRPKDHMSPFTT